jgi:hypothetical protein
VARTSEMSRLLSCTSFSQPLGREHRRPAAVHSRLGQNPPWPRLKGFYLVVGGGMRWASCAPFSPSPRLWWSASYDCVRAPHSICRRLPALLFSGGVGTTGVPVALYARSCRPLFTPLRCHRGLLSSLLPIAPTSCGKSRVCAGLQKWTGTCWYGWFGQPACPHTVPDLLCAVAACVSCVCGCISGCTGICFGRKAGTYVPFV